MDQREWKKITFRFKEPLPEAEEKGFDATFDRSQTPLRAAVEGGVGSANDSGSSWEVSNGVKGGSWSNSGIIGKNGLGLPCGLGQPACLLLPGPWLESVSFAH